jgi:hypothetical protein
MEVFDPEAPVDVTICFRSFYFAEDRRAFFRRVRSYTGLKFVFDFDPRVHDLGELRADLTYAGFGSVRVRRLLMPQRHKIAAPIQRLLFPLEPTPLSAVLTRSGFPPRSLVIAT